jgi:glutathione S-transferase
MSDFILHHYAASPFSEKLRLVFGFKGLEWRSVSIPMVMPKPGVVALTGGYRKTPFLQIGADVYCDTALIARLIEQLHPEPSLFPPGAPLAPVLAQWADSTLFWTVMPYCMQPAGVAAIFAGVPPEAAQAFRADRAAFSAGMQRIGAAEATLALPQYLAAIEGQLGAQPFLFGSAPCMADFSVVHPLWFMRRAGPLAQMLSNYPALDAWIDRVLAIGHGPSTRIDSTEALAESHAATTHATTTVVPGQGFEPWQHVSVSATDYGRDPVMGSLVGLDAHEVVLRRHDDRAGTVHVHFPRIGFHIQREAPTP